MSYDESLRGALELKDARRSARMGKMVTGLIRKPAGKVSEVFRESASRQGAYDFLEHDAVDADLVQAVLPRFTAQQCNSEKSVYVALDGSSLSLTDETGEKGFGSLGTHQAGGRGVKMLNALAVSSEGKTVGALAQQFWVRERPVKTKRRPIEKRESYRWHQALDTALGALAKYAPKTQVHVLADREGDASYLLQHLAETGCEFTIRTKGNRKVLVEGKRVYVRKLLGTKAPIARHELVVREKDGRPARIAALEVRSAHVQLVLRDRHVHQRSVLPLTVVWAREKVAPRSGEPIDWMLYTSAPTKRAVDAVAALKRYALRWRIEDFHRTLKRGGGCIEDSQLRSYNAIRKWATLHAIVASRAQAMRDAARTEPDAAATTILSQEEIEALVLIKTEEKRRNETVAAAGLSVAKAVRWIGDIGGFTATGASKAMPGATLIGRGLERVLDAAQIISTLRATGKLR
jgi:hypothetical protein